MQVYTNQVIEVNVDIDDNGVIRENVPKDGLYTVIKNDRMYYCRCFRMGCINDSLIKILEEFPNLERGRY